MSIDPAVRELIDALNGASKGMHAQANALQSLAGDIQRLEKTSDENRKEVLAALGKVHDSVEELIQQYKVNNAIEERTDAFRRETFDKVSSAFGAAAQSRPAIMLYAVIIYILASLLGGSGGGLIDMLLQLFSAK